MENMKMIRKILQNSIFEVLEKMFFVFLEPLEGRNQGYRWAVSISFSGDVNGKLTAYFDNEISSMMVQNMLSVSEIEVTGKLQEDCMKEAVNMISGDFLRNFDSSRVFDLSLPIVDADADGLLADEKDEENKVVLTFDSGCGKLGVVLRLS